MITDDICTALVGYLNAYAATELAGVSVVERGDESDKTYPLIVVMEDGSPDQHEVKLDEWTVPVKLELRTVPEDTTDAAHKTIADAVRKLITNDEKILNYLSNTILAHWITGGQGSTEPQDGFRTTEFPLEIMAQSN